MRSIGDLGNTGLLVTNDGFKNYTFNVSPDCFSFSQQDYMRGTWVNLFCLVRHNLKFDVRGTVGWSAMLPRSLITVR